MDVLLCQQHRPNRASTEVGKEAKIKLAELAELETLCVAEPGAEVRVLAWLPAVRWAVATQSGSKAARPNQLTRHAVLPQALNLLAPRP